MFTSFWTWLLLLFLIWGAAFAEIGLPDVTAEHWIGASVFFAAFFIAPLARKRFAMLFLLLLGEIVLAVLTLSEAIVALHLALITLVILGKGAYRLPVMHFSVLFVLAAGIIIFHGTRVLEHFPIIVVLIAAVVTYGGFFVYKHLLAEQKDVQSRHTELLLEYRRLKRTNASSDEIAREQERSRIAEQMHDSVGHKLTALVMHLEIFRMNSSGGTQLKAAKYKKLAQESLDETRKAVKQLRHEETGGISAVQGLIRKLEAESFVRVQFAIGDGVLSAVLTQEQSIVIYRTIQEALTNAMKHGSSREVEIKLEIIANQMFYVEVRNDTLDDVQHRRGFGLSAMNERLEKIRGQLEVVHEDRRFIIIGKIPLNERGSSGV